MECMRTISEYMKGSSLNITGSKQKSYVCSALNVLHIERGSMDIAYLHVGKEKFEPINDCIPYLLGEADHVAAQEIFDEK